MQKKESAKRARSSVSLRMLPTGNASLGLVAFLFSSLAVSQSANAQLDPRSLNPGLQLQQELERQQQQRVPNVQEESSPLIQEKPETPPASPDDPELWIKGLNIQGARVIDASRIEALFEPLLRKPLRFSQLQAALNKASNLYRDLGYFTSQVVAPKGSLKDGILTLQVVEGYIGEVEVIGKGGAGLKQWAKYYIAPLVSTGKNPKPIRFSQLERQLLLMQGVSGVRFSTTLSQGKDFGSSKLIIDLNPQIASGSVNINNNVQPQLGSYQVGAQLQANVLTRQPLGLSLYGSNAFPYPKGLVSSTIGVSTPIGNRGLQLQWNGGLTTTNSTVIPVPLGDGSSVALTTGGESWLGSLAMSYPIILKRRGSLSLSLSGEAQNSTSNTYVESLLAFSNPSRLRVVRLGVNGTLSTPFYASSANLQISQGLPIASAIDAVTISQTNGTLPFGSVSYTSGRLTLRHQQRIGSSNSFITASSTGQITGTTLPGAEDFSYGGPFLGRAYRGSYLVGDQGIAGGLEFSHAFSGKRWNLTPFAFGDLGRAWNIDNVPTPKNYIAASYGLGVRGGLGSATNFEAGWAIPAGPYPASAQRSGLGHSIIYFRAGWFF